jgi:hypothetical protein
MQLVLLETFNPYAANEAIQIQLNVSIHFLDASFYFQRERENKWICFFSLKRVNSGMAA